MSSADSLGIITPVMDVAQVTRSTALRNHDRSAHAAPIRPSHAALRQDMIGAVVRHLFRSDEEYQTWGPSDATIEPARIADYFFAVEDEPHGAEDIFGRVRWGGQFVYLSHDVAKLEHLPRQFAAFGFEILRDGEYFRTGPLRFVPFLGRKLWYFVARKMQLIRPRDISERFTYTVSLGHKTAAMPRADEYVVVKEVPTFERVMERLRVKFADAPYAVIEKRAMKFTQKVFPLFLTREAAMLKILARDLPEEYRCRVPTLLDMESDERGFARRIWMNWLRVGNRQPLSQLEFARQGADLLRVVHDYARIIHLDLRLDNMLITENGVCFIDFGSAVRVGENIRGNPLLNTIFDELMRTSQIQRMLYKMTEAGTVTSKVMNEAVGRVDKQIDLFYLAVQINQPLQNPDFAGLVDYDLASDAARALEELTIDILQPKKPDRPHYTTATEVLDGIRKIEAALGAKTLA